MNASEEIAVFAKNLALGNYYYNEEIMVKIASIILCAGASKRLKSAKSKILHEVCGRPVGYWPIKNALLATKNKALVVINPDATEIKSTLDAYFPSDLTFAYQEQPNGTAQAVKAALSYLEPQCSSVLVLCGDTPLITTESLTKLITIQHTTHVPIALLTSHVEQPQGYGRIIRNEAQQIIKIVEESEATSLEKEIGEVNVGVYVFDANFLRENINILNNSNTKKEYYITDLIGLYLNQHQSLGPVQSIEIPPEQMLGVNNRVQLAQVQQVMNRRIVNYWMHEGVSIIDPNNTYIEDGVKLEQDVVLYPGVNLRGNSWVKQSARIENGSIIINSVIDKDAQVLAYSWCEEAYIGERAQIGPFARLRAQTHLESDVKIGNFVEIKKSRLKSGTKAAHLSYIGDADIGAHCNVGAGAVLCNYDGEHKHQTLIGDNVFVGSNTTLVAPVTLSTNSYIAAGSVITKDVPENNLAIGRSHQVHKTRDKNKTNSTSCAL